MDKKTKNLIIVGGTLGGIALSYFIFIKKALAVETIPVVGDVAKEIDNASKGGNPVTRFNTDPFDAVDRVYSKIKWPLQRGSGFISTGRSAEKPAVMLLQEYLNVENPKPLEVDGLFGTKTESRLMELHGVKKINEEMFGTIYDWSVNYLTG